MHFGIQQDMFKISVKMYVSALATIKDFTLQSFYVILTLYVHLRQLKIILNDFQILQP